MDIIDKFLRSKWLTKAAKCVKTPGAMTKLALTAGVYLRKNGLKSVSEYLTLMVNYVKDVATGRYKGYSKTHLTLIVAAILYVVSPLDVIPDFLIVAGLIDDAAIIAWVFNEIGKELDKYKEVSGENRLET
ncbi:MAG: DUF1232 domain-containing protein [Bacteroidaceae bacterium]|nr:DUF1232 domain-containing protein [Bacteroidaceae bacterium]